MSNQQPKISNWTILPFGAGGQRGGILLDQVAEVLRACAISRLPSAPGIVEGIINVRGEVVPVVDFRARFGLSRKRLALTDRFVIVSASGRRLALHVDEVDVPTTLSPEALSESGDSVSDALAVAGVAKLQDQMLLIYDADAFLSSAEAQALEQALAERQA